MNKLLLGTMVCSLAIFSASAIGATRDLVFEDDEEEATTETNAQTISVKTTVELKRDGQTSTVAPNYEFKSGDKVKLIFTPNVDGYVYWLAKGSSGSYTMLFPNAKAGNDNQVKRNEQYTVPAKGSFKFDDTAGNEELLCVLSTDRIPEMDEAAANMFKDASSVSKLEEEQTSKRQTRDLVFEDEDEEDINTATQQAEVGTPFVNKYVLVHK